MPQRSRYLEMAGEHRLSTSTSRSMPGGIRLARRCYYRNCPRRLDEPWFTLVGHHATVRTLKPGLKRSVIGDNRYALKGAESVLNDTAGPVLPISKDSGSGQSHRGITQGRSHAMKLFVIDGVGSDEFARLCSTAPGGRQLDDAAYVLGELELAPMVQQHLRCGMQHGWGRQRCCGYM
jgi:hypothetical protein